MRNSLNRQSQGSVGLNGLFGRRFVTILLFVFAVGLIVGYEYYILRFIHDAQPVQLDTSLSQRSYEKRPDEVPIFEENPFQKPVSPTLKPSSLQSISSIDHTEPASLLDNTEKVSAVFRKILPEAISISFNLGADRPSVLIVGGTDGSGTRSVVQTLTDLGVSIVSEDPETYDIHADLVGGWPPIVRPVLRQVSNLRYEFMTLPPNTRNFLITSIQRLLQQAKVDSTKPTSHRLAVGGRLPTPPQTTADYVQYGFKAPVAMTLVPIWAHFLPRFLFLHVVRDGRDIAFSVNQGPVEKFFEDFYKGQGRGLSGPVKAIKLWSDWNSDIFEFAHQYHQQLVRTQDLDKSFGYHVVHTEDLVQDGDDEEGARIKFNALYHLAKFVHSSLSLDQLCCLSRKNSQFMGSHDRTSPIRGDAQQVTSRYGKWKRHVAGDRSLLQQLLTQGKRGLKIFGYEPVRHLPQAQIVSPQEKEKEKKTVYVTKTEGYECNLTAEQCHQYYPMAETTKEDPLLGQSLSQFMNNGQCQGEVGVDYKGEDISAASIAIPSDPSGCCR